MNPNNDEFCILPWVHASISNTGNVSPCCRVTNSTTEPFGSLHNASIDEIRKNENFSSFRETMLRGQTPLRCKECHLQETSHLPTLRTQYNKKFSEIVNKVKSEKISQALPMKYGEIRFSNICNLACRTCGIEFSSSWHRDHLKLHGKVEKIFYSHPGKEKGLLNEFIQHIDTIESIYFVGGEPLLHEAHYDLLKILLEMGRTDIQLIYNSNLTTLRRGENHALGLWAKFNDVIIYASIDATHERFNLIRHGENWETVEKNIRTIKIMLPKVEIIFSPTISVLNVAHLPDLIEHALNNHLVSNLSYFHFNFLFDPPYYQINLLPENQRSILIARLKSIISQQPSSLTDGLKSALNYINLSFLKSPTVKQKDDFKSTTSKLDFLRQERTKEVLPELAELLD